MNNVIEMKHPLIQHKISKLRDKNTGTAEFRALVEEIAMLMGYEALKDLPLEDVNFMWSEDVKNIVAYLMDFNYRDYEVSSD